MCTTINSDSKEGEKNQGGILKASYVQTCAAVNLIKTA